jgi:hypothetical protein
VLAIVAGTIPRFVPQPKRKTSPPGHELRERKASGPDSVLVLGAHGLRFAIAASNLHVRAAVREGLRHLGASRARGRCARAYAVRSDEASHSHDVFIDGQPIPLGTGLDATAAARAVEADLESFLAEHAPRRVFVHAGVVIWKGRAILLPGSSRAGKSSLVAALVAAGAAYFSDEFAVLDEAGRVHPFARRLALRQADGSVRRVWAEELGGRTARGARPIGAVIVARYREGATWRPRTLSPGQAALALLSHTVAARARSSEALRVLRGVAEQAVALRGHRGEAARVAEALLARLS